MAEHYIGLPGGLTACFKSAADIGNDPEARLFLGAHIPGLTFLANASADPDFTIEHEFSENGLLEWCGNHITIKTPPQKKFPPDLAHLFYGVARLEWMKRGLYPVHAACVSNGGKCVLIAGHSGAGKTTVAQSLVEKHGMKLVSGNKTLVRFDNHGSMHAVAGTKTMTALDNNLNRYAYEMAPENYAVLPETKITSVLLARINDGVEESQDLTGLSALHTLYPFFMDAVNADIIVGGKDIFDGSPPVAVKQNLAKNLAQALGMIGARKCSGSFSWLEQQAMRP